MVLCLQHGLDKCWQERAVQADGCRWHLLPFVQPGQPHTLVEGDIYCLDPDGSRPDAARAMHTAQPAQRVGAVRKQNAVRNAMQRQRLAARKFAKLAAQRAAAVDADTEGPGTNPS